MDAPCKGCTKRTATPNCHVSCEKYLTWKSEYDKQKQKYISTFIDFCKTNKKK